MKVTVTVNGTLGADEMRQLIRDANECKREPVETLADLLQDCIAELGLRDLDVQVRIVGESARPISMPGAPSPELLSAICEALGTPTGKTDKKEQK